MAKPNSCPSCGSAGAPRTRIRCYAHVGDSIWLTESAGECKDKWHGVGKRLFEQDEFGPTITKTSLVHTGTATGWYRCDGKNCPICGPNKYDDMRDCFWRDGLQYLPVTRLAPNLSFVKCARCHEQVDTVLVATGFAGEHEPLCGRCISKEIANLESRNLTGEMIIKADSKTGSTHMTDREAWGDLMAEQLNG